MRQWSRKAHPFFWIVLGILLPATDARIGTLEDAIELLKKSAE
jgi:hypothetical protein